METKSNNKVIVILVKHLVMWWYNFPVCSVYFSSWLVATFQLLKITCFVYCRYKLVRVFIIILDLFISFSTYLKLLDNCVAPQTCLASWLYIVFSIDLGVKFSFSFVVLCLDFLSWTNYIHLPILLNFAYLAFF